MKAASLRSASAWRRLVVGFGAALRNDALFDFPFHWDATLHQRFAGEHNGFGRPLPQQSLHATARGDRMVLVGAGAPLCAVAIAMLDQKPVVASLCSRSWRMRTITQLPAASP
jgi:hypothetical protein